MLLRSLIVLALLAVLWLAGIIDLSTLPWDSPDFQVSGGTVLLYLLWSAAEMNRRRGTDSLPYTVFYAVLLVSAVDGFLLEITTFGRPMLLRWAGLGLFAAGSASRLRSYSLNSVNLLRSGRYLQLAGLPLALGSISGIAVAALAGLPGSRHEVFADTEEGAEE